MTDKDNFIENNENALNADSQQNLNNITVVVAGMGSIINSEVDFVEKVLRFYGYSVNVNNPHPDKKHVKFENLSEEEKTKFSRREQEFINKTLIHLEVKHLPWKNFKVVEEEKKIKTLDERNKEIEENRAFYLHVTVEVSGLGGCINKEAQILEDEFRKSGYAIKVYNRYPGNSEVADEFVKPQLINLEADHRPWGG